jgi:hypothetical protein
MVWGTNINVCPCSLAPEKTPCFVVPFAPASIGLAGLPYRLPDRYITKNTSRVNGQFKIFISHRTVVGISTFCQESCTRKPTSRVHFHLTMDHLRVKILDQIDQLTYNSAVGQQQELQKLKDEYNRTMKEMYDDIHGVSCDILDIFPPEVWIQIIKESLPSTGHAPALLLLTMVSNKWRNALLATPTLWAHIEIRGSEHDSLATIETFQHLSHQTPLLLSIYAPPRHDPASIRNILARIGPRLREVTIKLDVGPVQLPTQEVLSVFKLLLSLSNYTPGVRRIQLESGSKVPLHHPEIADVIRNTPLPPNLQELRGWSFDWREMYMEQRITEYLERIDSFHPLEDVITSRMQLPELRTLNIFGSPRQAVCGRRVCPICQI